MRNFQEWLNYIESVKFTDDETVKNANLGSDVISVQSAIDLTYKKIINGDYSPNEILPEGLRLSEVLNTKIAASYRGQLRVIPVRIAVADPKHFDAHPYGISVAVAPLIIIWWSNEMNQGLTKDGKTFNKGQLYTTIAHELIHKLDRSIQIRDRKTVDKHPWFNTTAGNNWYNGNIYTNWQMDALQDQAKKNKENPDLKWRYQGHPAEVLARRDSFAYELARRLIATGSTEKSNSTGYEITSQKLPGLIQQLKAIKPEDMTKLLSIPPQDATWYQKNPKEFNKILSHAYQYIVDILKTQR